MLRLVRGLLPGRRRCSRSAAPDAAAGAPGLLVTSFLPGTRLDLLLPELDADAPRHGRPAARGVLVAGWRDAAAARGLFVDGDLRVEPFPGGDLVGFVAAGPARARALAAWPAAEYDALLEVADRAAQVRLDGGAPGPAWCTAT